VVAIAPGGSSHPRPGILPARLDFAWHRPVPTLLLTGDEDVMTPLDGIVDVLRRAPAPARLLVLAGADHLHFVDDVATTHESLRSSALPGDAAWIPGAMRPIASLCPPELAHAFTRSLALAHLDASLCADPAAAAFLERAVDALRAAGIDVREARPDR
jgi:hypothetical protein